MIYIRRKDKIEKEPRGLVVSLFVLGALTVISAAVLELLIDEAVTSVVSKGTVPYAICEAFLEAALVEETGKFIVLRLRTWRNKEFNYTFDAVVYAVAVSLGFATLENIVYVMSGSIGVAVLRGILSVPGHAIDAVFMGYYYGLAKRCESLGDTSGKTKNLWKALFSAVLIHGFYDFCLMVEKDVFIAIFLIFEVVITVVTIKKVNKLSREDSPIGPPMGVGFNQYGNYFMQNPYYYDPNGYYRRYDNVNQNMYYQQNGYNAYNAQQQYQQPYANRQYQYQGTNANSYYQQQQGSTYNSGYQNYNQQTGYNAYNYNNYYQQTPQQQSGYNYNNQQYSGYSQNSQNSGYNNQNSYYGGTNTNSGYYPNNGNSNNNYYNQ